MVITHEWDNYSHDTPPRLRLWPVWRTDSRCLFSGQFSTYSRGTLT